MLPCAGRLSLAVRSLERIIAVIPTQKLNRVIFRGVIQGLSCQKKVSSSAIMWVVSFLTTSGSCPCWGPSPICISHRLIPLASASPFPYPSFSCMLRGIAFQCQYFFKAVGYPRCRLYVQRHDSCSPGQAGCERALLVAHLLVFSAVHQRLIIHGGGNESAWVIAGVFHMRKSVHQAQGIDAWFSCRSAGALKVLWWYQGEDAWEMQSACACSLFLLFHILPALIWQSITSSSVN